MTNGVISMVELIKEKYNELEFIKQDMNGDKRFNNFYQKNIVDTGYENVIGIIDYNNIPITKISIYLSRLHSKVQLSFKILSAMYNLDLNIIKFLIKEGDRNIIVINKAKLSSKYSDIDFSIKYNKEIFKDKILSRLKDKNCRYYVNAIYVATYKKYANDILNAFNLTPNEFDGFLLLYVYRVYKQLSYYEIADIFDISTGTVFKYFKIFKNIHSYYKKISKQ